MSDRRYGQERAAKVQPPARPVDTVVITPSRGRPGQLDRLARRIQETTSGRAGMLVCADDDDPDLSHYRDVADDPDLEVGLLCGPRRSLSAWTNAAAEQVLQLARPPRWLVSMGDDHWPVTQSWDLLLSAPIAQALGGVGWSYPDDGFRGAALPTCWLQSASLVRALGWMMLPACEHMYVDNAVLELGRATRRITYVRQVRVEHRHPMAPSVATVRWDATYEGSNNAASYSRDQGAFASWLRDGGLAADAAKVRSLHH